MANFFQRLFISSGDEFANISLDAKLSEKFDVSSTITDHPIDTGGVISDHAFTNPQLYTIEGVVTDTPNSLLASAQTIGVNIVSLTNNIASLLGADTPPPATKRSVAAFQALLEFWENLVIFNVQTAMGLRENLIIQSMTATVDKETANMLRFIAVLREVPIISTEIVSVSNLLEGPINESGSAVIGEGVKQAIDSTADTIAKAVSFLG